MVAEAGGVPAGWYPDPLGLPQLRWWDGNAWTEFTSAVEPEADEATEVGVALDAGAAGEVAVEDDADHADEVAVDDRAAGDVEAVESTVVVPPGQSFDLGAPDVEDTEPVMPTVIEPEPVAPGPVDPFVEAETNAVEFTSRRARRAFERQREIETGAPATAPATAPQGYARLDTNPIDIRLVGAATPSVDTRLVGPVSVGDRSADAQSSDPERAGARSAGTRSAEVGGADAERADTQTTDPGSAATQGASPEPVEPAAPLFSLDTTEVADELAPPRTLIPKRTSTVSSLVAAVLIPLAVLALVALRFIPGFTPAPDLAWGILAGAYLIGVILAFVDRSALERAGHERTASPLLALLTPIAYLPARAGMTRRETGHGRLVAVTLIVGLLVAALLVALFPEVLTRIVPGFVPPWASIIG